MVGRRDPFARNRLRAGPPAAKLAARDGKRPSPPRLANCSSSAAVGLAGEALILGPGVHLRAIRGNGLPSSRVLGSAMRSAAITA